MTIERSLTVAAKEFSDLFTSRRFLLIFVLYPKLPENLGASLHQFYDKSLFSRKCPCNTIRIERSNELQRLKIYRHIIP
jgi:hypothetical protein